jgi:hypothetical protein
MIRRIFVSGLYIAGVLITVAHAQTSRELRDPKSFSTIANKQEQSRALFTEAAKVITSPRCMNCHPADDRPTQGNDRRPHVPPTTRGDAGIGVPGQTCQACHTQANYTLLEHTSYQSIPGHPRWGLAPIEMAWQGKTLSELCLQLKDPKRNGNRTLDALHEHAAHDDLVAWGWSPGAGREPAPGTQQQSGELIRAWIETGAECP